MSEISAEELKALIEQTYKVENEYISLRASYTHLQDTIEQVIEFLPNAIWVLESDKTVFLQNSKAKELGELLHVITLETNDYEISFENHYYLIKISHYQDKDLISATDITEQKRKENLATMGQMAAHLSHEIRNPIGSISLLSSTLMKRVLPENQAIVSEIQKSVYRIDRIIKATLMFSKGVKTEIKSLTWMQLYEQLSVSISYYSYSKDITFIMPKNDFELKGDLDLLSMMFTNFIFNAIDAIELDEHESGIVEIIHTKGERFHRFEVYDSGIAIENESSLFEAFSSNKVKGNGLGLILSKQIAQAHGGDVGLCQSERKGFYIHLAC